MRISSVVAGSLLAVLLAAGVFEVKLRAQDVTGEVFTVPFTFTADGHPIQAGTYEVRRFESPFMMSIENVKTGDKQLFSVRPEGSQAVPATGLLVFSRCGDRRELSEFHIRGTGMYSATIQPKRRTSPEMERCSSSDTTTIAAR